MRTLVYYSDEKPFGELKNMDYDMYVKYKIYLIIIL